MIVQFIVQQKEKLRYLFWNVVGAMQWSDVGCGYSIWAVTLFITD